MTYSNAKEMSLKDKLRRNPGLADRLAVLMSDAWAVFETCDECDGHLCDACQERWDKIYSEVMANEL